jgi:hypothetical protein
MPEMKHSISRTYSNLAAEALRLLEEKDRQKARG